jgi:hypothetical protein
MVKHLSKSLLKITAILILILLPTQIFPQSSEDFTGAQQNDLGSPQVKKWVKVPGQVNASASVQRDGSGNGAAYHPTGAGYLGFGLYDTSRAVPYEVRVVVSQLAGTTTADFFLFIDDNSTFATGGGYVLYYTQQSGTDHLTLREYNQYTSVGGVEDSTTPASPFNTAAGLLRVNRDIIVGDTLLLRVWSDRVTGGVKSGATYDTVSFLKSVEFSFDVWTGTNYRPGFGARVRTTPFKINDFFFSTPGAAAPPPSTNDVNPPVAGDPIPSRLTATLGQAVYFTFAATDDSAINAGTMEVDTTVGGYHNIGIESLGGAIKSYTFTSPTFTRHVAGNATLRARLSDHRGRLDTSITVVVSFSATPIVPAYSRKVYGWATFQDIDWSAPFSSGQVPADSLPWAALTHVGLFAASGSTPIPSSYLNQLQPMASRAHQDGVYAGLVLGGSGDANLIAETNNLNGHVAYVNYWLSLIDTYGIDFIDFDYEGTVPLANVQALFNRFYDSLQVRVSDNNSSVPPFIVLTVGKSRSVSWAALNTKCAFVNIMSYDFIGDWWCRLIHDASVKSFDFYDGTGTNTDFFAGCGANSAAPSMQQCAKDAIAGGWPAEKVVVGFDGNPTYYANGSYAGGRGPTYIRQPVSAGLTFAGSNLDFSSTWPTMSAWHTDSIHFDQIAQAYWIHTGTALADDKVWTFLAYPGRDSSVWATRRIVDSMRIGGVAFWNLGNEMWNTSAVPTGGRGWFFSHIKKHFAGQDSTPATLNPPVTFVPANNATGVSITVTADWENITGAVNYHAQVSTSQTFSTTVKDTSTLTVSQVALSLSNNTVYYYRVRVKNAAGLWGNWSSIITFTTIPAVPGTPTLSSPAAGATAQPQTITFFWAKPTTGGTPTHYELITDDDAGFGSPFSRDSTILANNLIGQLLSTISKQVAGFANSATYYWKVRAKSYSGGWGAYTASRNFTTGAAIPAVPNLLTPANGATNQATVLTLTWSRPAGADSFQVQIDDDPAFASTLKDTLTALSAYTTPTLSAGTTYYWRVYSNGTAGNSIYSPSFSFTVGSDIQPPAPGQSGYYVLQWNPISGKWEAKLLSIIESQNLDPDNYPRPLDTNGITWGAKGYKSFDGTVVRYTTGTIGGLTARQMLDSLKTLTLDSLTLSTPIVIENFTMRNAGDTVYGTTILPQHGNASINIQLPSDAGAVGVKNGFTETYQLGALELLNQLEPKYVRGLGSEGPLPIGYLYNDGSGNPAYRTIQSGDVPASSFPSGSRIIDSLNTNAQYYDTLTKSFTFKGDSIRFMSGTVDHGYISGNTTGGLVVVGSGSGSEGVQMSDGGTGNYIDISLNKNGLYSPVFGANDVIEFQYRASSTTRNDSMFQITDSGAAGSGRPVFQISNFGDIGGGSRFVGQDAFTTTAQNDTVLITGAATTDIYMVTITGNAPPVAGDPLRAEALSTGLAVHRGASGTSGLTYNWLRIRKIP